jgi:signal transduction histidine kinase
VLFELEAVIAERGIVVDVEAALPVVWCNDSRVRQVVGNLVRNAIKHGCDPEFPRIVISRPAFATPSQPGMSWLRIYDNGSGIPAAAREEIFLTGRRLPTARAEGTGMGLAIVKRIVEHYGGTIEVDGHCLHGAAFVMSLPSA